MQERQHYHCQNVIKIAKDRGLVSRLCEISSGVELGATRLREARAGHLFCVTDNPVTLHESDTTNNYEFENGGVKMTIMLFTWITVAVLLLAPMTHSFAADNGGKEMYLKYCASCHGNQGKGDGPVSRDLKVKVSDLTLLRSKNKGTYPVDRVMSSIDGSRRCARTERATCRCGAKCSGGSMKKKNIRN